MLQYRDRSVGSLKIEGEITGFRLMQMKNQHLSASTG